MLPNFPEFKKLELSDQSEIEQFAISYDPYSDFNFGGLWSWDTQDIVEISVLNKNLVLKINDHFSDQISYTYLGNNRSNETVKELFNLCVQEGIKPELNLVPEISLDGLDFSQFMIEIDLNNCDYIYEISELASYEGNKFSSKRKIANSFTRKFPNVEVRILDMQEDDIKRDILQLNDSWSENKSKGDEYFFLHKEGQAIKRFLDADFNNSLTVGVYVENKLVGFSIYNLHRDDFAICHFAKADIKYAGIYEYMMRECCSILKQRGFKKMNYEEDLGLPGLRYSKNSFKPIGFLRKYKIKSL